MLHETLVRTGIEVAGDLSWGSHICLFYEAAQDLIDANADYFRAGLESGDFCLWAVSDPLSCDMALQGLRERIPDIDAHVAAGRMELTPGYGWYLRGRSFDPHQITSYWLAKLADAKARGCSGMRASGNAFWLETDLWSDFREYEADINHAFTGEKMLALCTYPLKGSSSTDLLEVARLHKCCITRRRGRWELLETLESLPDHHHHRADATDGPPQALMTSFPGHGLLTPKERVVLWQLLKGASAKESARLLGISPRTVEFHRGNIMRKLGARTTTELFARLLVGEESRLHGAA
jgi:DNA-binding CsgD family transcriptional regulator